ncbi:MAG TPA: hypothetical protein EYQ86_07970, partial [Bacteroidetes bacterium]|nr:hypothetical protein [Bacteroidota bacterium]
MMPELAEVKISSDFVNTIACGRKFTYMTKSEVSKVNTDLDVFDGDEFKITSKSRGKELKLIFENESGITKELMIFLGMSGTFVNIRNEASEET